MIALRALAVLVGLFPVGHAWAAAIAWHDEPRPVPAVAQALVAEWRGGVVLLNVWATWCAPCRAEFPMLDRVAEARRAEGLVVLPLAVDRAGRPVVERFYAQLGARALPIHVDPERVVAIALGVEMLPTSILLDRQGREIARVIGPLDWEAGEGAALLDRALKPSD
ncbi:MAG: TlpA family protein disulfide reductase [Alphaproteobacteria bacterium]|nr:TlpA family protein disulfide reductase [Alphaproteobacteria bacterium]